MATNVRQDSKQSFTDADHADPVCGGYSALPRGEGIRCPGFQAGSSIYCYREEYAGSIAPDDEGRYRHRAYGECPCGVNDHLANPEPVVEAEAGGDPSGHRSGNGKPYRDKSEATHLYDYRDRDGTLRYQVARFANPKDFRPYLPGRQTPGLEKLLPSLYNLDKLATANRSQLVVIAEGEKDCDRLQIEVGALVTCNSGGAGKWEARYGHDLAGFERVAIFHDLDVNEVGLKHAQTVADSLRGKVGGVRIITLPAKDVSEWLDDGHTAEELRQIVNDAFAEPEEKQAKAKRGIDLKTLPDFLAEPEDATAWVVDDMLAQDGLSLMVSRKGRGKSTTARTLAACVAEGLPFLNRPTRKGKVMYLSFEGSRQQFKSTMAALRVNGDVVLHHGTLNGSDDDKLNDLEQRIAECQPVLVIIDTLGKFLHPKDWNDYAEVNPLMERLADLASRYKVHIALLHHTNKSDWTWDDGLTATLGSTAIAGAVDAGLILKRENSQYIIGAPDMRYGTPLEPSTLVRDATTGRVSIHQSWEEKRRLHAVNVTLAALDAEPQTKTDLLKVITGADAGEVGHALNLLLSLGYADRSGEGKKGNPFRWSKLKDGPISSLPGTPEMDDET